MAFIRVVGQICLFFSVLCLGLISVSAPIVPRIAFVNGHFSDDISLFLGMTGGCITVGNSQTCPPAQLGYSITLDNFPNKTNDGPEPLNSNLTFALVVFPLAAIFGLLACLFSLPRNSRVTRWITLALNILTFILSAIGLAVALALFINGMNRINSQFAPATPASLGPAVWIAVAAVILVAFSGLLIASHKPPKKSDRSAHDGMTMKSKGASFQTEPHSHKLQFGSYSRPNISEPQYVHQGMQLDFAPNEGSLYTADDRSSIYSASEDKFRPSSYYGHATGKSRSLSGGRSISGLRRSASRASNRSKR